MKASQKTEAQKQAEQQFIMLVIPAFMCISAAFTGAFVAWIAGGTIEAWVGFKVSWWVGLLIGGSIGLALGVYQALTMMQRSSALSGRAAAMGMERLSDEDVTKTGRSVEELITGKDIRFWDCHFRRDDNAKIVIGDMGMESSDFGRASNETSTEHQQTCFYIEFEDFIFPEFQLQPEGLGLKALDKLTGGSDIEFEDSPDFSKNFFLTGRPRDAVRKLFSKPVRDNLELSRGFTVVAKKNRLVIYRLKHTCRVEEIESFLTRCLGIINHLQASGVELPIESLQTPPMTRASALAEAEQMGGIVGALLKRRVEKTAIDVDEVTTFLSTPVPRTVPRQLHNQVRVDPFLYFMCVLFSLAALVIIVIASLADADLNIRALGIGIASLVLIIFGTVLFLIARFARRRMRLLTHGRVRNVLIDEVTETAFVNGSERVFQAKFHLLDDSDQPDGSVKSVKIQGYPATVARQLAESGQTTQALQDKDDPSRLLLVDCLAIQ